MYGMINKAAQELIVTQFGDEKWRAVKKRAGIDVEEFNRLTPYPDEVTYDIIASASEILDLPVATVLETFGKYWISFTINSGYEPMFSMSGNNLFEFLKSLDELHTRLSLSFPNYRPPSFYCADYGTSSLRLHYISEREGLAPFVVGLVKGLGDLFATPVTVTQEKAKSEGASHDVFLIEKVAD